MANGIANLWAAGGPVMYPLAGCAIVALVLVAERSLFWWRLTQRERPLAREVLAVYPRDPGRAIGRLRDNLDLPLARIFLAALELDRPTPEEFRLALESEAQAELPGLKRFGTVFETIVNIAPLLGLLGTILGLIDAFAALRIGELGGGDTANVTGGISEALVSTAVGLVVAILTLLFANTFRSFYRRQLAAIAEYGGQLELLHRRYAPRG